MTDQKYSSDSANFTLTLREIASWQVKGVDNGCPSNIHARMPSLQRGAVWEPQQIELLWDSIFRGFPIGSIVVIKKIDGQSDKSKLTQTKDDTGEISETETTHHILDGQQRCNAIAWGFVDPWLEGMNDDVVLWLDLLKSEELLKKTTRKYLFRVTTKADPWGFHHGDEASNLSTEQRRKFWDKVENLYKSNQLPPNFIKQKAKVGELSINKRPLPSLTLPYDANFPVPVFLLFKHFSGEKLDWDALAQEEWIKLAEIWTASSLTSDEEQRREIESGLRMAEQSRLIALSVSDKVTGIDNIEQIFQRLNGQGTPLDNEELIYSMIKAYWSEIENVMSNLERPPITAVRLVNLGVRIALTDKNSERSEKLASPLTVDRIRKIFKSTNNKSKEDVKDKNDIENYFKEDALKNALSWIDNNFLYNKKSRSYGLPAYLRSSIAWSSPEIFAWLMLLAKRYEYKPIDNDALIKKIIGLALTIHWFSDNKSKVIDILVKRHADLPKVLISDLKDDIKNFVLVPLSIEEMQEAFQLSADSTENQLKNWTNFWQGIVLNDKNGNKLLPEKEVEANKRKDKYGFFVEKLRQKQELLVYAQREYIEDVFEGFDPANKLMWKGHNRPWDYDHILASAKLNAQGYREELHFHEICKTWQQSIGNQVAVDFSFNREAQDTKDAVEKYKKENIKKRNMNINIFADDNALESFKVELSKLRSDSNPIEPARNFVLAAKDRLIKVYQEWYDTLEIEKLTEGSDEPI